jgi:hypothetical protein
MMYRNKYEQQQNTEYALFHNTQYNIISKTWNISK